MSTKVSKSEMLQEIGAFLDDLYRDKEGYVYTPTLNREDLDWQPHYYKWPEQREQIIQHAINNTSKLEVYISPALYKSNEKGAIKDNVLGSNVVWAEFDGVAPAYTTDIPEPGFWLNSSTAEHHMHVYWPLSEFCSDPEQLEKINRALTHNLGADSSGWDSTQVLRFPLTINHKRKQFTSKVTENSQYQALPTEAFDKLASPAHKIDVVNFDFTSVPHDVARMAIEKILGADGMDLFDRPAIEQGGRSSALMALAYYMAERRGPRLNDHEMFAVLRAADDKWGKFKDRKDRNRRLLDIIVKAREKYPYDDVATAPEFGFDQSIVQLLADQSEVDWVVKGLLERAGLLFLAGPPGCGKTQVSLQFALHMACGKPFLGWEFPDGPKKVLFVSMEMGSRPLRHFLSKMWIGFTEDEQRLIEANLRFNAIGYGIPMDTQRAQDAIEGWIQNNGYDGVFFDSLGQSTTDDLTAESTIKRTFEFVNRLKMEYDCFVWFIHHTRKAQAENKRPNKLADLYGSQYIAAHASAVVSLYPVGSEIEVKSLKVRLEKDFETFRISRLEATLGFHIPTVKGLSTSAILTSEEEKEVDDGEGENQGDANLGFK